MTTAHLAQTLTQNRYVVVIALGPVQDFIATARRCRDLWFGSWLLSEISKAAAAAVQSNTTSNEAQTPVAEQVTLVFPSGSDLTPDSPDNVANKIVAVITGTEQQVRNLIEQAETAAHERLDVITMGALGHIRAELNWDNAEHQIRDLLEWSWAAVPLETEDAFGHARQKAERLLAMRKNVREFNVPLWASHLPKSSLDGCRESVIPESSYNRSPTELYDLYHVRRGERLCGVGLLKRHGQRNRRDEADRFFSTSHVAVQSLLERWSQGENLAAVKQEIENYIQSLRQSLAARSAFHPVPDDPDPIFANYDGHLLFEGRLEEFFNTASEAKVAREKLNTLLRTLGGRPNPYYAILLADGDRMGAAISRAQTIENAQQVTILLSQFAGQVKATVEAPEMRGSLIYAGGDDVLALLPLHSALSCARKLADMFRNLLAPLSTTEDNAPTLSVGLAVVHHLEPLSQGLDLARRAERAAKDVPGKNALAVGVAKRSGADVLISGRWSQDSDDMGGLDARLNQFISWARAGDIAAGLPYEWRDIALRLTAQHESHETHREFAARQATLESVIRAEARRVLERKRESNSEAFVAPHIKASLRSLLTAPGSLLDRANELIVAQEFAQAQNLAWPQPLSPSAKS